MNRVYSFEDKLPVLEAMIHVASNTNIFHFEKVAFVCVQHLLHTTFSLLEALVRLGAKPDNIHVMGKSYSTCLEVAKRFTASGYRYYPNTPQEQLGRFAEHFKMDVESMWRAVYKDLQQKDIKLVIILDDGGNCLAAVPDTIINTYSVIGVEQTTSGLTNLLMRHLPFPIIEVASSAAKQYIESPMIAEAVTKKLNELLPINQVKLSCGVVGLGVIGVAVAKKLLTLNHNVITYDKHPTKNQVINDAYRVHNLAFLLDKAEFIFGCTGEDVTKDLEVNTIRQNKVFISCSSQDKEFLSLLQFIQKHYYPYYPRVLEDIECSLHHNVTVKIFRGGFPVNLDDSGESVTANDIQLTRGLLLGGVLQAFLFASKEQMGQENIRYMLCPDIQRFVVAHWLPHGSRFLFEPQFLYHFDNRDWIRTYSRGIYCEHDCLSQCFKAVSFPACEVYATKITS